MYIIGVVSTLKLYQCRHPDIHVSAQKVFLFLALCILVNVVGVFYGKQHTWFLLLVALGHLAFCLALSRLLYTADQPQRPPPLTLAHIHAWVIAFQQKVN